MDALGFDVTRVVSAIGTAPLPPRREERPARHRPHQRLHSLRRSGALHRRAPTTRSWPALAERLPASASADYGTPFYDIFKRYDNDFYKIDPLLFSPAEVWLTSATSGRTFHAGRLNAGRARGFAVRADIDVESLCRT